MSFFRSFVSYTVDVTNSAEGIYETVRFRAGLHEDEDAVHYTARLLAYLHSYAPGLAFHTGAAGDGACAFEERDPAGSLLRCGEVGAVKPEQTAAYVRGHPAARVAVYFYRETHVDRFLHGLRGSRTNWIDRISFYSLDAAFLEELSGVVLAENRWSFATTDGSDVYLGVGPHEFATTVGGIDMWDRFQSSIGNRAAE